MPNSLKEALAKLLLPFEKSGILNFDNWLPMTNTVSDEILSEICKTGKISKSNSGSNEALPVNARQTPLWGEGQNQAAPGASFFMHISLNPDRNGQQPEKPPSQWFSVESSIQSLPFRFTDVIMVNSFDCEKLFAAEGTTSAAVPVLE